MSRYPSKEVARFDQQFAKDLAERYVPRGAADVEVLQTMRRRIKELERALGHYKNCRHACVDCFCTVEARAALNGGEQHG